VVNALDFPLVVDGGGRIATTGADDHVRDMIEQILFTRPGERVMRPDFGCGVDVVFEPNSEQLAGAMELQIRGSLQRWLGDVAQVADVRVRAEDSRLVVEVAWRRLLDGAPGAAAFVAGPAL
jgi:Bacteriophage baseplate protein W